MPRTAIFPLGLLLALTGALTCAWAGETQYNLTTLHQFDQFHDFANGSIPATGVWYDAASDALYGTTVSGGRRHCHETYGCGTVFVLTADGNGRHTAFARLHVFTFNVSGSEDGDGPGAVVLDGESNLYGTAQMGGDPGCDNGLGCGVVYMLEGPLLGNAKPKERVLHVFENTDGLGPYGRLLVDANTGTLYGTTYGGGTASRGTVFRLTPNAKRTKWDFAVVYNFQNAPDGVSPTGALITDSQGTLYGTTRYGGKGDYSGNGTVFSLHPVNGGWKEKILFDFGKGSGATPVAGLTPDGQGNFFVFSNRNTGGNQGGYALELEPNGSRLAAQPLYRLRKKDGSVLNGDSLVRDQAGDLFGVAAYGGLHNNGSVYGLLNGGGTYTFTKLYDFCALAQCSDGALPYGLSINAAGNLYGTTDEGGVNDSGVVFMLSPGR